MANQARIVPQKRTYAEIMAAAQRARVSSPSASMNMVDAPQKRTYAELMAAQRARFQPVSTNLVDALQSPQSPKSPAIKDESDWDDESPITVTTSSLNDIKINKKVKTSDENERPKNKAPVSRRSKIHFRGQDYVTAAQWHRKTSSDGTIYDTLRQDLARIVRSIEVYMEVRQDQKLTTIRTTLARVAVSQQMNAGTLKASDFLERILQTGVISERATDIFPPDIIDDCADLWQRLNSGNLDGHPLRGISRSKVTKGAKDTSTHANSLDKSYPFKKPADRVGSNGQNIGACWPYLICALRDGCHGAAQAGIYGNETYGAISILSSESYEDDRDEGEEFWYSSTKQKNDDKASESTAGTKQLDKAFQLRTPVRVIRSGNNTNSRRLRPNPYRPAKGYRYDGLYRIEDCQLVDQAKHLYRYRFVRLPDQSPIRFQGETARPNKEELQAWENIQAEVKMAD